MSQADMNIRVSVGSSDWREVIKEKPVTDWITCPECGKKLCRTDLQPDTTIHEIVLYLWCKKCKKEVKVNIK